MTDFALIEQLNTIKDEGSSPLAVGIDYQQYEVKVDGKPLTVSIPLREAVNFEKYMTESAIQLTRKSLKLILREFRGIRA